METPAWAKAQEVRPEQSKEDGPLAPPDLGGHPGLMLLYAERLARNEKPAWFPAGKPFEYVEWVFHGLGKGLSARLHAERRTDAAG